VSELFYRPTDAWAADFIPFFDGERFRLFYLLDWRDREGQGEGTPWYQISTTDFVHFAEHGEMLARGTEAEQDLYVFTGCVVSANGRHHIFYTGHNPHFDRLGKPVQAVMHVVSDDLQTWRKVPEDTFFAPDLGYEKNDWRDPFVFWNPEAQEWWMLLAARLDRGPSRRRGCVALCASPDLKTWEVREPFWTPGLYFTHECPDLFQMGDWWYLVWSEFSDRHVTRYRMSRSLAGPWTAPENDTFDGRAYYAAKSASDGRHRYLFGWNPTRDTEKDYQGRWQWGGNLVVHELLQAADGTLHVCVPETIRSAFSRPVAFALNDADGREVTAAGPISVDAGDSYVALESTISTERVLIEVTVTFTAATRGCGLLLRTGEDGETGYQIRLEPGRQRLVLDSWPRPGDIPFMVELERPLVLLPNIPVTLQVFVDGTICEIYVDRKVALSARLYNLIAGGWGIFVQEGHADFNDLRVFALPPDTDRLTI
jgi:beta-fructofuranosidase